MASKDAIDLAELMVWAKSERPDLIDERFRGYDGWTQLLTLKWERDKLKLLSSGGSEESFDEDRIDIIGQNGNDGEHYEEVDDGDK